MIHNMTGGGAGLKLKVIGGIKPITGDTLIWDCDTTGLITVGGTFAKVSDITPSLADLSKGGSIYLYAGGALVQTMELTVSEESTGVLLVSGSGFVILSDGLGYGGKVFPEAGIYLPTDSGATEIVVQINGYTGFGGTVSKENTIWVDNGSDTLNWDGQGNYLVWFDNPLYWATNDVLTYADLSNGFSGVLRDKSTGAETAFTESDFTLSTEYGGLCLKNSSGYYLYSGEGTEINSRAGTYLGVVDNCYIASITVPGFTFYIDISAYAFSADEPASPAEGMVWVKTATESTTPINVDKKNSVILYPQTAQQYVSGAWVGKTAQVYTNGAWHELWDGYYYKLGETYEAITGGYSAGTSLAKVTFNSNNMVITQASGTGAGNVVATVETVDVTDVNTLVFDCLADSTDLCSVGVGSVRDNWNNYIATAKVNNTARALVTLDVSSITGEVYILLKAWFNSSTYKGNLTVYNIYKQ